MWEDVGVVRRRVGMERGLRRIGEIEDELEAAGVASHDLRFNLTWHDWLNLRSLQDISRVIALAGLERENSRVAHYREDFPDQVAMDESYFTVARREGGDVALTREPVAFTIVRPGQTVLPKGERRDPGGRPVSDAVNGPVTWPSERCEDPMNAIVEIACVPHTPLHFVRELLLAMMEAGLLPDDRKIEMIDGVLIEMSPANNDHGVTLAQLIAAVLPALPSRLKGATDVAIFLGKETMLAPDLTVVPDEIITQKARGADLTLAVEVSDTTIRDDLRVQGADRTPATTSPSSGSSISSRAACTSAASRARTVTARSRSWTSTRAPQTPACPAFRSRLPT